MPEGRRKTRLPRPGEIEALQTALDNLLSKINSERDRMRTIIEESGLGASSICELNGSPMAVGAGLFTGLI